MVALKLWEDEMEALAFIGSRNAVVALKHP